MRFPRFGKAMAALARLKLEQAKQNLQDRATVVRKNSIPKIFCDVTLLLRFHAEPFGHRSA